MNEIQEFQGQISDDLPSVTDHFKENGIDIDGYKAVTNRKDASKAPFLLVKSKEGKQYSLPMSFDMAGQKPDINDLSVFTTDDGQHIVVGESGFTSVG